MQDETHDPEMSYRRGYHHGAQQVFDAIKHCLPAHQRSIVHTWIAEDVCKWRVTALKGAGFRHVYRPAIFSPQCRRWITSGRQSRAMSALKSKSRQLRWLICLVVHSSPITRRTNVCVSLHASNNRMRENSLKGHVPAALWA